MTSTKVGVAALILLGMTSGSARTAEAAMVKCHMTFSLRGWSVFYSSASGSATIDCDNGQSTSASIRAKGGGLTVGKENIVDGRGDFSGVTDISQVFGKYGTAEANAGAGPDAAAQAMTKGSVSLALSGKGQGVSIGVSFGEFVIERRHAAAKKAKPSS